jgi:dUTP pyrophosphatase
LINLDSEKKITIKRGERIAQLVIKEISQAEFVEVEQLPGTSRGEAGFGSSGKS